MTTEQRSKSTNNIFRTFTATVALLLMSMATPVLAQQVTMETLLDRIQIEDLITRYYFDLSEGGEALSEYFTVDALLDVDSMIAVGHEEIEGLYSSPEPDPNAPPAPPSRGRAHMLLTNAVIDIDGDTAIAHVIWTGVLNPGVGQAPTLYEQGREDTKLVKIDGKWLMSERYISSDSGLPDKFDATYEPRGNPFAE